MNSLFTVGKCYRVLRCNRSSVSSLINSNFNVSNKFVRTFVSIGDKVPVNFIKDGKDPLIMADEEYPPWVLTLTDKLPTKNQLLKIMEDLGGVEGDLTPMGEKNLKRLKKLINRDQIKLNNLREQNEK